ncbi:MAG: hypothetical protein A2Y37_05170 [Spirochaetes bacterium GWB1_60_80]|nr:MAG: 5-methylcytosine restriction system component-like protein [candidate division Kazan bacterium GW2011_GWC1_52_13]OHD16333.1 MAG: hypothetical protein A2Y37_05170 [Spirochaetes bacterium GWB1_60_80]OHD60250.1 MAG: hypothetical protein A2Y32_07410 [Spirochaetes bacterium GWF1_60_12]HAX37596.1 hypothetical protein [Spirochaetaceae bacterium]HBO40984.1 hypothetical protein [Spirochaetaceae bacterium]
MQTRRIRVFERSQLIVGQQGLEERDLALLARYEDEHRLGAFEIGWHCLKLKEHVGVFASGDLVLEILPKAEAPQRREDAALVGKWSRALRGMLAVAYDLPLAVAGSDQLESSDESLLDFFARHFLAQVRTLVRGGLAKGYRRVQDRVPGVKGKFIVGDLGIDAIVHRERQLCEYDVFDQDIIHNRLLAQAVAALRFAPLKPATLEEARALAAAFPDLSPVRVTAETFAALSWDRRTTAYKSAMDFARLILLGQSPIQRPGETQALTLLFAMNDLFETYIGALMLRAARQRGWKARLQSSLPFWEDLPIRPDIVLEADGRCIILDTKWKVLSTRRPGMDDLRQMYAYNRFFAAEQAYLVYPDVNGLGDRQGHYRDPDRPLQCGLIFVSLFDGDKLASDAGERLLAAVTKQV